MMDTSGHNNMLRAPQQNVVRNFTGELNLTMEGLRQDAVDNLTAELKKKQDEQEGVFIKFLPFMKYLTSRAKEAEVEVHGGYLRVATGTFNNKETRILHSFYKDLQVQADQLAKLNDDHYDGSAQLLPAMTRCHDEITRWGHDSTRRFCIVIGDNEAMCQKNVSSAVREFADFDWGDEDGDDGFSLIPDDLEVRGETYETAEEVKACSEFSMNDFNQTKGGPIELMMMFIAKDEEDAQKRLKKETFRSFVEDATGCTIVQKVEEGKAPTYQADDNDKDCLKFVMATKPEEIMEKSRRISKILTGGSSVDPEPNNRKDYKYLFFLILPLNLVFYIIWSKIIRCTMHVKKRADRAMGVKKKMIKVTKTLVEKPRRDSVVDTYEANLTEVELAEVASLRPVIEFGDAMNLRARLKGGYLHANFEEEIVDGNGQFADPTSNWVFEPVSQDGKEKGLQSGQKVRIRNARGDVLKMTDSGSAFIRDDSPMGSIPEDGYDLATEFFVESMEYDKGEEGPARLGDTVRIKCSGTGKYIQIHKNGKCDGAGGDGPETQFNIDLGGATIADKSLVKLQSTVTGHYLFGAPGGGCSAMEGGDAWAYWMMEKKAEAKDAGETTGDVAETIETSLGPLKVGDVITLKGMNQEYLEVSADGAVHCGKPPVIPEDGAGGIGGRASTAQRPSMVNFVPGSGIKEFVVERVGMGTVRKQDNTIRRGAEISLRPVTGPGTGSSAADSSNHIRVDQDGLVAADGRVTTKEIGFTIEVGTVQDMLEPVEGSLMKGDVDVMISPLWNKNEIKRIDALSAAWTKDEDLSQFKGAVVVASANGQYTVPKAKGAGFNGWVAVVQDGVDIVKAAKQAKSQGATGLIIKTSEVLSLEKLGKIAGQEQPDLPAVFMDDKLAKELNERGIEMKGCEFKGKKKTDALRALGRMGHRGSDNEIDLIRSKALAIEAQNDVFKTVGALMVEKHIEEINKPPPEAQMQQGEMEDDDDDNDGAGKGFKWKVASNTHYLWSSSGGGATKMNVNFGKKAPPAASKREKIDIKTGAVVTDASKDHVRTSVVKLKKKKAGAAFVPQEYRSSVVGSSMLDVDDFKNCRLGLADELGDVHGMLTEAEAEQPLEQLPDDSDFKIEYAFEEVEIAAGEKVEDLAEEELIDDAGAVVGQFAVPVSRFWIVAIGMILSTALLTVMLVVLLKSQTAQTGEKKTNSLDENLDGRGSGSPGPSTISAIAAGSYARWDGASAPLFQAAQTMDEAWQSFRGSSKVTH